MGRDIIFLKVDDHYIDVHTSAGSCLVLMRFADAVADLGALGMRVHRSYWVAYRHMLATVRRDRRTMLRVTGGRNVPISRPCLAAVRVFKQAPQSGDPAQAAGTLASFHGSVETVIDGDDTVAVAGLTRLEYRPDAEFSGEVTFTFQVTDQADAVSEAATGTVQVAAVRR